MISVIIPVYNAEKYIQDCCAALVNQTYKNIEIIFINDGSSDNSGNILDELKASDSRIIVVHKTNGGVSSARNAGLEICRGKYIMFCDADDIPDCTWCEEMRNAIERYPDRLPVCLITVRGTDLSSYKEVLGLTENIDGTLFQAEKEYLIKLEINGLLYSPCNKIFLTDTIRKNNILFDQTEHIGEDADFNFKYLKCVNGKTVTVNKSLYNYVMQNENSATKTSEIAWLHALEFIFTNFEKLYSDLNIQDNASLNLFYVHYWDKYIHLLTSMLTNKAFSRNCRFKQGLTSIKSYGFQSCLKNAPLDIVGNKKLINILSNRTSTYLYLFKKIFINK